MATLPEAKGPTGIVSLAERMSTHAPNTRASIPAIVAIAAVLLVLATPVAAFAHVPSLEPEDSPPGELVEIMGPDISRAIYGYLSDDDDGDLYVFSVSEPTTRTVSLLVPAWSEHEDFKPQLFVQALGHRPLAAPWPDGRRQSEFEPFSLTSFWWGPEIETGFLPGEAYVIRVDPGEGDQTGRYVVAFDGPEEFEGVGATLAELPRIWLGTYGGAPQHANPLLLIPLLVIVALIGATAALARRLSAS